MMPTKLATIGGRGRHRKRSRIFPGESEHVRRLRSFSLIGFAIFGCGVFSGSANSCGSRPEAGGLLDSASTFGTNKVFG
jgi:hypothetical protein